MTRAGAPTSDPEKATRQVRLTINTAAVWRDWVRDQATLDPKSPRAAAVEGEKSIATAGEPRSADTTVVVVVAPDTRIETRYRSSTDEVSEGARTPEGAAKAQAATDPADTSRPRVDRSAAKPAKFTADDLKPGVWVEVHYKDVKSREKATLVRVMRPIGGPQTSAADDTPPPAPAPMFSARSPRSAAPAAERDLGRAAATPGPDAAERRRWTLLRGSGGARGLWSPGAQEKSGVMTRPATSVRRSSRPLWR